MPRLTVSDRHSGAESGRVLLCIPMVQRCAPSCVSAPRGHWAQMTKPAVAGSESPAPRLAGERYLLASITGPKTLRTKAGGTPLPMIVSAVFSSFGSG
jgi:hypothetical protein